MPRSYDRGNRTELQTYQEFEPDNQSMIGRMVGIIRRPRATFQAVVAAPRWVGLLAVLFCLSAGVNALFLATAVGQQALVDQWERTALAFGQDVDDARYEELQELSRQGTVFAVLNQLVRGPLTVVVVAVLVAGAFRFGGVSRHRPAFRQVLAVVAYSTVILTVREIMAAPINYARETIAAPTTLVQLFPVANAASPAARFFGLIDAAPGRFWRACSVSMRVWRWRWRPRWRYSAERSDHEGT